MTHRSPAALALALTAAGCAAARGIDPDWTEPAPQPASAGTAGGLASATRDYLAARAPRSAGPLLASLPGTGLDRLGWPAVTMQEGQDLPPVEVRADRISEEAPVGASGQPEWTTERRFARSRVYVLPEGQIETELWYRGRYDNGRNSGQRWQAELGVGLPHRLQVDYYQNFTDAPGSGLRDAGPQVEGRWALADWGRLPWNPTIYGEYRWDYHGADKLEAKLLFGETLAPRWHAAFNLIGEQETSGARATEFAVSGAISYTVIDRKLSVGAEITVARVTENGTRGNPAREIAVGPSIQWRFTERAHLDVVPLIGVTKDAHDLELFVVLGYDFGGGGGDRLAPTSTKSQ